MILHQSFRLSLKISVWELHPCVAIYGILITWLFNPEKYNSVAVLLFTLWTVHYVTVCLFCFIHSLHL